MNILITDDSLLIRKAVGKELSEGGYSVIEAESGEEALIRLAENSIDLIILDVEMGGMDGFETCKQIQALKQIKEKPIPIIFFTASDDLNHRLKGFEAGATDFLRKDFEQGDLLFSINKILKADVRFKNCTALVVDDSNTAREIVKQNLRNLGIRVLTGTNGQEGFELYLAHAEQIDIIIADYHMPHLTGLEMTQKIRRGEGNRDIPIIILTGNKSREEILTYFNAGATDYIFKPFLKEEFMARVYSHIDAYHVKRSLKGNIRELKKLNDLKDRFLSICSHDLRSPLTSIIGHAHFLNKSKTLEAKYRDMPQIILQSGNYLLRLINNLLDLDKIDLDDFDLSQLDLGALLGESIKVLTGAANLKSITIEFNQTIPKNLAVEGDELKIKRIFTNLLSNAIKFTPDRGKIRCELTYIDSRFVVTIQDNGVGISPARIATIWHESEQKSTSGTKGEKGKGLGLSIVKSLITKHHGSIEVESKVGQGTRFTLIFPPFRGAI